MFLKGGENMDKSVQVLAGANGIKKAYGMTLAAKKIDIICLSENYSEVIGEYFDKVYQPKLAGSLIKTREILPSLPGNTGSGEKNGGHDVRFVSGKSVNESDLLLTEREAILISFDPVQPGAVIVRNEAVRRGLELVFNELWAKLA
jgi:hypothetical protein